MVILAVLPVSIIAIWLSYTEISNQFRTLDTSLTMRADTIAHNLSRASEVAIVSGNQELLDQLALSTLLEEDVLAVTISTKNQFMSAHAQQPKDNNLDSTKNGDDQQSYLRAAKLTFSQPILLSPSRSIESDDLELLIQSDPILEKNNIGDVELTISTYSIEQAKQDALVKSIAATLLAVVLTIAIGLLIGRAITNPIVELSEAVKRIEKGNLDVSLESDTSGELKTLQTGFISMASTIRSSQESLQDEVEHATSELRTTLKTVEKQNTALESARQKEHEANQAKSEFLANISHEIRTPMNAVIGFADILKETDLDKQQAEYISTIKKSGEHLVSIINDILDLSRIEAGKLSFNPEDFNLRNCLEDVIQLLAPQAEDNGNELILLVYNDVPDTIHADPLRIKQIVLNLIHNALKFTQNGTVVLRVMDEGHDDSNIFLGFKVEDNGIGIEEDDLSKLFTAYNTAQNNHQRRSGGTGLGLSITHKLIESMGGHIEVESKVNEGTSFHCHINVQANKNSISKTNIEKPLQNQSVLIFDNHNVARLAVNHMLNRAGAKRVETYNFSDIFEDKATEDFKHFDIIIVSLPRDITYDENALLRLIENSNISIRCFLTPEIEKPVLNKYKNSGVDIVINRPVRENNLIKSLIASATSTQQFEKLNPNNSLQLTKKQALIVDDHDVNLRLLSGFLNRLGYNYVEAKNGNEAIQKASQRRFDIVFMDIHMPEVDGIEATKAIRNHSPNKETPIVALTADAISFNLKKLLAIGFNDRLVKPIIINDLRYQLQKWCKFSSDGAESNTDELSELKDDLSEMLLKELPEDLELLTNYSNDNNLEKVYELGHKIHSASCYCNWPSLTEAANRLEQSILNKRDQKEINENIELLRKTIGDIIRNHA